MISNISSNYALFLEERWAKIAKTQKMWSVFFPEGKKTEKCASGEVGRRSYVITRKKKLYPFVWK